MAEEIQKKPVNEIGKVTHSDGVVLGVQGGKAVAYGVNEEGGLVTTDKVNENLTFGDIKEGDNNVVSGGDVYKETKDIQKTKFKDELKFFNNFDAVYSTTSKIGFIVPITKTTTINNISIHVGYNTNTTNSTICTIGYVDKLAGFNINDYKKLTDFEIQKGELNVNPKLTTFFFNEISIPKDKFLVILFNNPLSTFVFDRGGVTDNGRDILYMTPEYPDTWSYGYRKSSGVIYGYSENKTLFDNKILVCLGDSIKFHYNSYFNRLVQKYRNKSVMKNFAVSGARFQDYASTVIDLSGEWNNENNTIYNQVLRLAQSLTRKDKEIKFTNPQNGKSFGVPTTIAKGTGELNFVDVVIIDMGTNDTKLDKVDAFLDYISQDFEDLDRKTNMVTGMMWAINAIRTMLPNAKILVCSPIQGNPTATRRFEITKVKRDRIKETAGYLSTYFIDSFYHSGICEKYEKEGAQGRYLSDGLHPNDAGKVLMTEFMENKLKEILL